MNQYEQRDTGERKQRKFVCGKVFLGGLTPNIQKDAIESYCSQWGQITEVHMNQAKGFAFATFANVPDAQNFLDARNHTISGQRIDAKAAVPKDHGGNSPTKKLFVGGVFNISDEDFTNYFSQFGVVESVTIPRKPDGSCRGYGFVNFTDEISVEKCLVQEHTLNNHRLDCKRAVPKDQYQASTGRAGQQQFTQQHQHHGMHQPGAMPMMNMMPMIGAHGQMMPMMGTGMMQQHHHRRDNNMQGDKWTCSCGNINLGWRHYCNKCKERRYNATAAIMPGNTAMQVGMTPATAATNPAAAAAVNPMMMMGAAGNPSMMPTAMMGAAPAMMPQGMAHMGAAASGMMGAAPGMMMGGGVIDPNSMMQQQQQQYQQYQQYQQQPQQQGGGMQQGAGGYIRGGGRGGGNGQNRFRPY